MLLYLVSCNSAYETVAQNKDSSNFGLKKALSTQQFKKEDSSFNFVSSNYLKLSNICLGPVHNDKDRDNILYRIIEIPNEESLQLYAEQISIGEEGGNYKLLNRYQIGNEILQLSNSNLYSVDSLAFIDSTIISGYFNNKKMSIDLNSKRIISK